MAMRSPSRREFLGGAAAAAAGLVRCPAAEAERPSVHQQLLDRAAALEKRRRERFAAISSPADLEALQRSLRDAFLTLLDGLPDRAGPPEVRSAGKIEADGYTI